jgi:hypothetical protein
MRPANFHPVAVALWIAAPIVAAGLVHVAIIRLGWLASLAKRRLDFGGSLRGRPVFGENKTWRGAVVMIAAAAGCVFGQVILLGRWAGAQGFAPAEQLAHPLAWGALAGAGYILGELPNSFAKRQLGVSAGAIAAGWGGAFFWIIDQVDSVGGVLVLLSPLWTPTWPVAGALFGLTLLVHPLVALVMFCLGLKTRVG